MSDLYKVVPPKSGNENVRTDPLHRHLLFKGNYGVVYLYPDGQLLYEYQTGELGDPLRVMPRTHDALRELQSGDLSEEQILRSAGF